MTTSLITTTKPHPRSEGEQTLPASADFRAIFEGLPGNYVVLRTDFTIIAASDAFLRVANTRREELLGRNAFDAFPDNPDDLQATGTRNLRASFERVIQTGAPDSMAVQKYDIPRPEAEGGGFEERYWSPLNSPLLGPDGKVAYIIHRVEDVTEFVRLKQRGIEQARRTEELKTRAERVEAEVFLRAQEIQRANEQLRVANEQLSRLDELKTRFFSNVSHEFRTPLTLMLCPIDELLTGAPGGLTGRQRELVELARRNARRLLKLVNSLLDFARIETARMQMVYEALDLSALTAEVANAFRATMQRAGLRLVVDCPPLPERIYVDREMWEKIVLNLVSNAFKFTFEGEITVSLRWGGDHVLLEVRDTGTGIPADELPRIFERFHRIQGAPGRSHEGSGIGLALVRELVRFHMGDVHATSEIGRGSTFTVRIPAGAAHVPAELTGVDRELGMTAVTVQAFVEEASHWGAEAAPSAELPLGSPASAGHARPAEGPAASAGHARPAEGPAGHVLLVEDNPDMRSYLRDVLAMRWTVEAVENGEAALCAARARVPDLVLSDVMMPGIDGFGLLEALRADPRTRLVPVVLLSARSGEASRVHGAEAGADDYLVKPFSVRELLARVGGRIEIARLRRQVAEDVERLRESEQRFRSLADCAPMMIWMSGPSGSCEYVNRTWLRFTGRSLEEELGDGWLDAVHADDRPLVASTCAEALETREPFTLECRMLRRDGEGRWVVTQGAPRFGAAGAFLGFVGSSLDITERKRVEDALAHADRRKDEFLAMLAHELRNPMAPICVAVELIRRRSRGGPPDPHVEVIARQTKTLMRLVDDLLDVSRITRRKIELRKDRIDVKAAVARAVESTREQIEARRHQLRLALPRAAVHVLADPVRLEQILVNLLTNACKYTDLGGHIGVTVEQRGDQVELRVRDDGIGIAREVLPQVFELFHQADRSLDRAPGGLGIGLTIVRDLVALHGGSIEATSPGLGQGSEFIVRLPVAADERAPAAADERVPAAAVGATSAPSKNAEQPSPVARKLRVLIVEDNVDAASTLADALLALGQEVWIAGDGPRALRAAAEHRPDLVLLDIGLPGMDGYEVARRLREAGLCSGALVALTGYGQASDRRRAEAAGFDAHFVKPMSLDALAGVVDAAAAPGARQGAADGADASPKTRS
ncbi:ATP-binding protein [Sorangium sp. So ce124]|uniref:ATP-binding protein n=1 Tax=Sorangium sp. So ce124 TaxID=3133280 RepID=UPI003F5F7976